MSTTRTTTEQARADATTHATDRRRAGALPVAGGAVALAMLALVVATGLTGVANPSRS